MGHKKRIGDFTPYYSVIYHDKNFGTELPSIISTESQNDEPDDDIVEARMIELNAVLAEVYFWTTPHEGSFEWCYEVAIIEL